MRIIKAGQGEALPLTERERQIVALATLGKIDKEIALELGISAGTVTTHWYRIRAKLRANTRAEITARFSAANVSAVHTDSACGSLGDLLAILPEAALATDDESRIVAANAAACDVVCLDPNDLEGRPLCEVPGLSECAAAVGWAPHSHPATGVVLGKDGRALEWSAKSGDWQGRTIRIMLLRRVSTPVA